MELSQLGVLSQSVARMSTPPLANSLTPYSSLLQLASPRLETEDTARLKTITLAKL